MLRFSPLRTLTTWLLLAALSGVAPALAAEQPGVPASSPAVSLLPRLGLPGLAALPQNAAPPAQDTTAPAQTGASPAPAKHHVSRWVWVLLAAGAAAGAGAGIVSANNQSTRTAATAPGTTINAGSGVTAGAPH